MLCHAKKNLNIRTIFFAILGLFYKVVYKYRFEFTIEIVLQFLIDT